MIRPTFLNRKIAAIVGGIVGVLLASSVANAVPITGEIHFGGTFAAIDSGNNLVTLDNATGLQFNNPSLITVASGHFAGFVTPFISTATFIPSFNFNPLSPSPVDPLWTAGGFSFVLNSVQIVLQSDVQLNLLGSGYLSGNGFDLTYGTWNFQGGTSGLFTFRANDVASGIAVPDGGNTLLLLGTALIGLGIAAFRKQFNKVV